MAPKREANRSASEFEEQPSSSRRKLNISDESASSGITDNSASTHHSESTQASPPPVSKEYLTNMSFENYYKGLRGNGKLLARSNGSPWSLPMVPDPWGVPGQVPARKLAFLVSGRHPIAQKLLSGLGMALNVILSQLNPRWISTDFLRLGYDEEEEKNPVTILVTVEEGTVSTMDAERIVKELFSECVKASLAGVEVEMMEGRRAMSAGVGNKFLLPNPTEYPLAGASIAISREHKHIKIGCGTLAGYIVVDGTVFGLTNHHVVLSPHRDEPFPTDDERANHTKIYVEQPPQGDLENRLEDIVFDRDNLKKLEKSKFAGNDGQDIQDAMAKLDRDEKLLSRYTPEHSVIGSVYRSSGNRVLNAAYGQRYRMDWALIELKISDRTPDTRSFVNQMPLYTLHRELNAREYFKDVKKLSGQDLEHSALPQFLKRGLKYKEVQHRQEASEDHHGKYVGFKFGRTTHYTHGAISEIHSNYEAGGLVSDELMVKDNGDHVFSAPGDSGAFVYDSDGYVIALLWGAKDGALCTYATPIEAVLDDIKACLNAKEVRLVVRDEEVDDTVFEAPRGQPSQLEVSQDDIFDGTKGLAEAMDE